jgi:predicted PurR-regulated permease PerM
MNRPRKESSQLSPLLWLAGAILILYFARVVLIPLALALTLNFLLTPMVMWLQRLHLRRVLAVAIAMLVFTAALAGMGWIVADQLLQVASDLPKYRLNIHNKIAGLHLPPESALGRAAESVKEIDTDFSDPALARSLEPHPQGTPAPNGSAPHATTPLPVQVVTSPSTGLRYVAEVLTPLLQPLGMAGMVLIFTAFILMKQEDLRDRFLRLAGVAQLHAMTLALDDAAQRISRYLLMQFVVNACYGICFGIGVFLIGIPNALLWGVVAGLFRIVPYAGALAASLFPFMLAVAIFNGWGAPLLVVLLFAVLDMSASNIVEPWLYGAHTGISSLALLVMTVFWTLVWGWAGLVLATPLTVCAIVLGRYVPRMSFLHVLLGDETALSVEAQFYQRLLALDQDDARSIVQNFVQSNSLLTLYDRVMIPALGLAEQDRHRGALDETRESFLFLSTREIVSELAVYRPEEVAPKRRGFISRLRTNAPTAAPAGRNIQTASSSTRIFCLAANDQADEIASSMLAQILERAGHGVIALPVESQLEEILKHLAPEPYDVICISAVPPFAIVQAASLCQRVRLYLPEIKILVGIWGSPVDINKALERFGGAPPDAIVATLAHAIDQINKWGIPPEERNDFSQTASPSERTDFSEF